MGATAQAIGSAATALGTATNAKADLSLALGSFASANNENDVALGANSSTDKAVRTESAEIAGQTYQFAGAAENEVVGTVSVGTQAEGNTQYSTITNVAAGRISATSTDAINGSQLNAAVSAINMNTEKITQIDAKVDTNTQNIQKHTNAIT